jgi:hypothetical protein
MTGKFFGGVFCLAFVSTVAHAQCDGNLLARNDLNGFGDQTVSFECVTDCSGWMDTTSPDWHERHVRAGRVLEELGKPGTPSEVVGTWEINNNPDEICYRYNGDLSVAYCYQVFGPTPVAKGETYQFCNAAGLKAMGTVDN